MLLTLGKRSRPLHDAIDRIAESPLHGPGIKKLFGVPSGYRRRVGRYRILYTTHPAEVLLRIWIIDMEKDTKKDYRRWMGYIMEHLT